MKRPAMTISALAVVALAVFLLGTLAARLEPKLQITVWHPAGCVLVKPKPQNFDPDTAFSQCFSGFGKQTLTFNCGGKRYLVDIKVTKERDYSVNPLTEGRQALVGR